MLSIGTIDIILVVIAALVGSGGLAVILKYGTRISITELRISDLGMRQDTLNTSHVAVREEVAVIKSQLPDLHDLKSRMDTANSKLDQLTQMVSQSVPRPEQNARWESVEHRIMTIENSLRSKKD